MTWQGTGIRKSWFWSEKCLGWDPTVLAFAGSTIPMWTAGQLNQTGGGHWQTCGGRIQYDRHPAEHWSLSPEGFSSCFCHTLVREISQKCAERCFWNIASNVLVNQPRKMEIEENLFIWTGRHIATGKVEEMCQKLLQELKIWSAWEVLGLNAMRDILNLSFRLVKFVTVEVNSLYLEGQTLVCIEVLIQGLKVGSNYLGWASSPRLTGSRNLYYHSWHLS